MRISTFQAILRTISGIRFVLGPIAQLIPENGRNPRVLITINWVQADHIDVAIAAEYAARVVKLSYLWYIELIRGGHLFLQ